MHILRKKKQSYKMYIFCSCICWMPRLRPWMNSTENILSKNQNVYFYWLLPELLLFKSLNGTEKKGNKSKWKVSFVVYNYWTCFKINQSTACMHCTSHVKDVSKKILYFKIDVEIDDHFQNLIHDTMMEGTSKIHVRSGIRTHAYRVDYDLNVAP